MATKTKDPWAALDELIDRAVEPEGPEWFFADDVMKRKGLSRSRTHVILKEMVDAGKLEVWTGWVRSRRANAAKFRLK